MSVKVIALDIDGVMTDGTMLIDQEGRELKSVFLRDVDAYFRLKRAGYRIGFITGEDTPVVEYFQRRFAPDFLFRGCKDKLSALNGLAERFSVSVSQIAFCGDALSDVEALKVCGHGFAPSDAHPQALAAAQTVLDGPGGRGAIESLAENLNRERAT